MRKTEETQYEGKGGGGGMKGESREGVRRDRGGGGGGGVNRPIGIPAVRYESPLGLGQIAGVRWLTSG